MKNVKNTKNLILTTAIGTISLVGGILIGGYVNKASNNAAMKNQAMHVSKIAVVNDDQGALVNNVKKEYGKELITQIGGCDLTSIDNAKRGIENGEYSAYIKIPGNFSKNFVSISTNPKQSTLQYELNEKLDKESATKTWGSISKLKEDINDKLGYHYIAAILKEFHKGQDNAQNVMENEQKDKEALMQVTSQDLVKMVDIHRPNKVLKNIKDLSILDDTEANKKLITKLGKEYEDVLSKSDKELKSIKEEQETGLKLESELNPQTTKYVGNKIKPIVNEDGELTISLTNYDNTLNILKDTNKDIKTNIQENGTEELQNTLTTDVSKSVNEDKTWLDKKAQYVNNYKDYETNYDMFKNFINKLVTEDKNIETIKETLKEMNPKDTKEEISNKYENLKNKVNFQVISNTSIEPETLIKDVESEYKTKTENVLKTKLEKITENIVNVSKKLENYGDKSKESLIKDLKEPSQKSKEAKENLEKLLNSRKDLNKEQYEKLKEYQLKTIEESEKDKIETNYEEKTNQITKKVEKNKEQYEKYSEKVEDNADKEVGKLKEDVEKAKTEGTKQVEKGLTGAKKTKIETTTENKTLLKELVGKLAYTRINKSDNDVVYNVINHPVSGEEIGKNGETVEPKAEIKNETQKGNETKMWYVVIGGGILGTGLLIWHFLTLKRK